MPPRRAREFETDDARWRAVARRDRRADGRFVYAVRTTGVYCRPSCGARLARRGNVEFHATPADAERAGFRPCKRCKPEATRVGSERADAAVAEACRLIDESVEAPNLNALAAAAGMSPSHFHRVFKSTIGLTPKAYATAHRARRAREAVAAGSSITASIYRAGFNSNGRFYATSAKALGMKPSSFRAGGEGATIRFAVGQCSLGSILVAASKVGICAISLGDDPAALVKELQDRFPRAELIGGDGEFEQLVARVNAFVDRPGDAVRLPLDLQGTAFQHRVWRKLCEIPCGQTRTYSQLARELGEPNSARAVARACAANPVAVAVPCHRVVRTDGSLTGYRWGIDRKAKLLEAEQKPR